MLGREDAPPRSNGELLFRRLWEGRAFGMAIALSKKGHYEWEAQHCKDDPDWDYYERWLLALEKIVLEAGLLSPEEIEARTAEIKAELRG